MNLVRENFHQTLFQDLSYLNSAKTENGVVDGFEFDSTKDDFYDSSCYVLPGLKSFHKRVLGLDEETSRVILFNAPTALAISEQYLFDYANLLSIWQDSRVLVVDCNLVTSKLDQYFQSNAQKGLCDYVANRATAEEIIGETDCEQVYLVKGGAAEFSSLKLLMSPKILNLLDDLKRRFDYVLLNSCPYHQSIDAFVLAKFIRPTILLLPDQNGPKDDVSDVYDELGVLKLEVFALAK